MASLRDYADGVEDILRPYGDLDLILYYGLIAEKLQAYLHGRELATLTRPPKGRVRAVVKRGSLNQPFYIAQMAGAVTPALMDARKKFEHLDDAKHALSPEQALAWFYFMPRRYMGFLYATNREGEGREINRVIYEIVPGRNATAEDAIEVAALLAKAVTEDDRAAGLSIGRPFVSWTGSSFIIALSLKAMLPASFYRAEIEYTGNRHTLTDRLVTQVTRASKTPVIGGSARPPGHVIIDPSQTPSGQLSPVPLGSLHMESGPASDGAIGGVSVPLTLDMLHRDEVADLRAYTPRRIIEELDGLARRLPG